jgi:ribosome-associated protein
MQRDPLEVLNIIAQAIFDKKGFNILAIDVRAISTITDYFVIAEGTVDRHVRGIGEAIVEKLKEIGEQPLHIEGVQDGDWVVLDFMSIIIHLFIPQMREKYRLEELWKEGSIVDVKITVSNKEAEIK